MNSIPTSSKHNTPPLGGIFPYKEETRIGKLTGAETVREITVTANREVGVGGWGGGGESRTEGRWEGRVNRTPPDVAIRKVGSSDT